MINGISDEKTTKEVMCERLFMQEIGADCKKAIGAYCHIENDIYYLECLYDNYQFSLSGKDVNEVVK